MTIIKSNRFLHKKVLYTHIVVRLGKYNYVCVFSGMFPRKIYYFCQGEICCLKDIICRQIDAGMFCSSTISWLTLPRIDVCKIIIWKAQGVPQ